MGKSDLVERKNDHLDIVLDAQRASANTDPGFSEVRFEHCALPDIHLDEIDLSTHFLGRKLALPLLISSMTGGAARAVGINRHLAEAAQHLGIALAIGSQRVALETGADQGLTRELRRHAPDIPLLANLGAAQLVEPRGLQAAARAVDMIEADALIVHLNPLQEAVQAGGDRNWQGVLDALAQAASQLSVPIVVKEVGAGISAAVARRLVEAGVAVIDVAGAGGTSWAAVEGERAATAADRAVAMAFADWGIPTARALVEARHALPHTPLIASGGIRSGIDVAKALRLGADIAAQAAAVLQCATESTEAVVEHFEIVGRQLRIACFCTGSANLAALRQAALIPSATPVIPTGVRT